jgi:hypothetical protein
MRCQQAILDLVPSRSLGGIRRRPIEIDALGQLAACQMDVIERLGSRRDLVGLGLDAVE